MQRFRFRLERLRWYRQLQAELAQQALAVAVQEEAGVTEALGAAERRATAGARELRERLFGAATGADLALHSAYEMGLRQRRGQLEAARRVALARVAERRAGYATRQRDAEVVELLRRDALERHRRDAEREEQALLDDVGSVRAARRILSEEG